MSAMKRIDDCLTARDGRLFVEECDSTALADRFGTPLFVISEDQVRRNTRRFQTSFQQGWPDGRVVVMPAAKANWISAIQYILADEGCGCDIYSPGELAVALDAGFPPEYISVNGVPKDRDHIFHSVKAGARLTIDSVEEVDVIAAAARETGRTAKVRLRLKPALSGFIKHSDFVAEGLAPTDVAALAYKGGLVFDQIREIGPRIMDLDNVELVGFHQHHGRHNRSTRFWEEQMIAYAREMGRVSELLDGYQPEEIDIGGGFAVPRDPFAAAVDYTEPLQLGALHAVSKALSLLGEAVRYKVMARLIDTIKMTPNQTPAPSIEEYGQVCTRTLRRELPLNRIDTKNLTLQLEPGRSLHGNTGIHLTRVCNLKKMTNPLRWNIVVVDTTEFWFTGGRYEHHLHDYLFANRTEARPVSQADIIGRSCYGDRLMPMVPVPEVRIGDLLALLDTGAYQEVSMSNFNALPRPATILVTGDQARVIRRAESQDEVFRRDEIPEHLKRQPKNDQPVRAFA